MCNQNPIKFRHFAASIDSAYCERETNNKMDKQERQAAGHDTNIRHGLSGLAACLLLKTLGIKSSAMPSGFIWSLCIYNLVDGYYARSAKFCSTEIP